MKATEVRVGNYVEFCLIEVEKDESLWEWVLNPVEICDLGDIEDETSYRAIPLTEAWLNKFGISGKMHGGNPLAGLPFDLEGDDEIGYSANFGECYSLTLEHVHQLQNLYFDLTGEELELK